jgi:hypothetical protein
VRSASKTKESCNAVSVRFVHQEGCGLTSAEILFSVGFAESVRSGVLSRRFQSSGWKEAARFPVLSDESALESEGFML